MKPTISEILDCADAYGDARIMASRGRVERSEVDEARKALRAMIEKALGPDVTVVNVVEAMRLATREEIRAAFKLHGVRHSER